MALTNAERQKKYRERMRNENPVKYQEIKNKNAERNKKRKKIIDCSEKEKEFKRKQWRINQQRRRNTTKDTVPNNDGNITVHLIDTDTNRDAKRLVERKRLQKQWLRQKKIYEDKLRNMASQIQCLKKRCKRYMLKNKKLIEVVNELKLKSSELKLVIQGEEEMTPLSKSNSFIKDNLPNISEEEKEKVKRQLLTHNVLVNAIQDTYEETKKDDERIILKRRIENKILKKYNKKSEITTSVFGLKGRSRTKKNIIRKNNIILNEILTFFNRDDVSRATAGKKEIKTKGKIIKQRRYLLNSLKELYKKYRAEGGRAKMTSFKKYKPFYVLAPKLSDRETCGCVKHENFFMKIKKLNNLGIIGNTNLNKILSEVVCDLHSKECAYGECSTCKNKCIKFNEGTWDINENVTWNEFTTQKHEYINKKDGKKVTTTKMVKKEMRDKLKSLTESFNKELKIMRKHVYNIKHQYSQYSSCIKNLKCTEVAIHIDFSENYVCKLGTEVQSMHFGASKSQVTIHTGVLYVKERKPQSFASLSPCTEHGPEAIWAHLKPILNYVRKECPLANAVHFFSDGPATQYKQKKNFFLFTNYTKKLGFPLSTWNFSESAHGKGAADGVGGGLKRRLDDFVKHGIDIPEAYTAYTLLKNSDTSVMTFYIQEANIVECSVEENLAPIPQTMNIHQITNSETTNVVRFRCLSCFCDESNKGYCECFDVKNHQIVKVFTSKRDTEKTTNATCLKRKKSEESEMTKIEKGKKKAKVTVLSEVRYTAENMAHDNLQNFIPFRVKEMKKFNKDFDLFNATRNKQTYTNKENINYDNPIPSTSGTSVPKKMPTRRLTYNSDGSNTDRDDLYSLHDSSEDFLNEDLLSDTDEEIAEKIEFTELINANDILENLRQTYDCELNTSTGILEKNINKIDDETVTYSVEKQYHSNINNSTAEKLDEYINKKNANDTDTHGLGNNIYKKINDNENVAENLEKMYDCSLIKTSIIGIEENNIETTRIQITNESKENPYNIKDSVLVRYYLKNKWKYYIGFIEKIECKENNKFYTIRFLKTIKKPTLKFITTKKVDRDVVPEICILKKIDLDFDSKEYILKQNDCADHIYF